MASKTISTDACESISTKASETISTKVNVKQCSLYQGDTEYHCGTCDQNLCLPCKNKHNLRMDTKHHNVILYREKLNSFKIEMCATHPDQVYEMYCETCDLPVCLHCDQHKQHNLQNIRTIYEDSENKTKKPYSTSGMRFSIPQKPFVLLLRRI